MDNRLAKNGTMSCLECRLSPHPWCRCIIGKQTLRHLELHFKTRVSYIKIWGSACPNNNTDFIGIGSVGPPIQLTRQSGRCISLNKLPI